MTPHKQTNNIGTITHRKCLQQSSDRKSNLFKESVLNRVDTNAGHVLRGWIGKRSFIIGRSDRECIIVSRMRGKIK